MTVTGGDAGSQTVLFTASAVNGFGQYTDYTLGNAKATKNTYTNGFPVRQFTPGIQDLNLTYDYTKGNLLSRNDALKGMTETFQYDNANRLTAATINTVQQLNMTYKPSGNILSKTDAGNYVYKTDKVNAVAYITNPAGALKPPDNISVVQQELTYTPFLKTATVIESPYQLYITYGPDDQRIKTQLKNNGTVSETKYFLGNYEKQVKGTATREIHYVSGGNGLFTMIVRENGVNSFYFVYTDPLGSLLTITDIGGNIIAQQNFDAWGRYRNPSDWTQYINTIQNGTGSPDWLYRGYTGHEQLPQFALINMNGRMYDPIQARMMSIDNYVSMPTNSQGYNRYSYALNNPLKYTDPNGEWLHILIGAAIGGLINLGIKAYEGKIHGWGDGLKAFGVGALAGGVAAATGGVAPGYLGLNALSVGGGIAAGGSASAVSSVILGTGNSAFFGDPYSAKQFAKDVLVGAITGGIMGGIAAGSRGNNIWTGDPVARGRGIYSFNNSPINESALPSVPVSTIPNGTFGSSGSVNTTITRMDGTELIIRGDNVTGPGALAKNIIVQGNPQDLWQWITNGSGGTLNVTSGGTQIFNMGNITYSFYQTANSTGGPTIIIANKEFGEFLKFRF